MSLKKLVSAILVTLCIASSSSFVMAAPVETTAPSDITTESTIEIVPFADVIVTKYRDNNGVPQYRRWNETRGYWVDPVWINL